MLSFAHPVLLFAAFTLFSSDQRVGAFGFARRQRSTRAVLSVNGSGTGSAIEVARPVQPDATTDEASRLATKLIETCRKYGQVGSQLSDQERSEIESLADALSPFSDDCPARETLTGQHELVYSASPSASSGKLGPFTGDVTQSFLDETSFINRVELFGGLAKVELNAERKIVDDTKIKVFFKRTDFFLFGKEVKSGEVKGAGMWDYRFSGLVELNGERILLRVIDTPSLFVIIQREECR